MALLSLDNTMLDQSRSLLASLEDAKASDLPTTAELDPLRDALTTGYARMRECGDNIATADTHIEALEKAAHNWRQYRDYQRRRYPGLERRYIAARDYIRAAEDEQTGTAQ